MIQATTTLSHPTSRRKHDWRRNPTLVSGMFQPKNRVIAKSRGQTPGLSLRVWMMTTQRPGPMRRNGRGPLVYALDVLGMRRKLPTKKERERQAVDVENVEFSFLVASRSSSCSSQDFLLRGGEGSTP